MESEAIHLRELLHDVEQAPLARWQRSRGWIGETQVDLIVCGIGLAYSAAATSAALIENRPAALLNYGCAGAHRDDINAGDVVVATSVAHLASYVHQPDGSKHLFGFRSGNDPEDDRHMDQLPTGGRLVDLAREAVERADLPPWPGLDSPPSIHFGPVGSADVWTQHVETIRNHHQTQGTLCEDMEAAAIAQIAALFGVPFLAIKDISNNELQKATAFDAADSGAQLLDGVQDQVGRRAALLSADVIRRIGRNV